VLVVGQRERAALTELPTEQQPDAFLRLIPFP
jgi:hypothetical protein